MWFSVLVGAQPRKGKTFTARLVALHAALDPWVKLIVVDGKKSPDWLGFRKVAHRMVFGELPNPLDDDPIGHLLAVLDEVLGPHRQGQRQASPRCRWTSARTASSPRSSPATAATRSCG